MYRMGDMKVISDFWQSSFNGMKTMANSSGSGYLYLPEVVIFYFAEFSRCRVLLSSSLCKYVCM